MIVSVHLAEVGWRAVPGVLRSAPRPTEVPGLRYAETVNAAQLSERLLPTPQPGRVGLIAAWDDDASLDAFSAGHPLAERFAGGWHVRLQPLRVFGRWAGLEGLPPQPLPVADEEPVAVLTLGRLRLARLGPFLRASARAEGDALASPALLASTGLARLPKLVATFSIWRSAAGMLDYAQNRKGSHVAATTAHSADPFHSESAFVRFRPYASQGSWNGVDPLAALGDRANAGAG